MRMLEKCGPMVSQTLIYKKINILKSLCKKNNISFINGLSILEKKKQETSKKIYNYPAGNLSGHLKPDGE